MKKFYLLFLGTFVPHMNAQDVFFAENFGTVSTTTPIASHAFQNGSPVFYTGNADIRNSTPSVGYSGASGNACVFLGGTEPAKELLIEGIDTSDFTDITLSVGQWKGVDAASNQLLIQVSADGENFTPLTYIRPSGSDTSVWVLINPTGSIPSVENLRIKITNPVSNYGYRIDDLKLSGNFLSVNKNIIEGLNVYPNPVANGVFYIKTSANESTNVVIFDVLGKQVHQATTENSVNISSLSPGIYVVKITEKGKTATRKLVVK